MKNIMLAAAVAFGAFAGAAAANEVSFNAYGEYAFEAQSVEVGAGATYAFDNGLALGAEFVALDTGADSFSFDHADVKASYALTEAAAVYGKVTFDSDLEYSESVVGVALSF